MLIHRFSLTSAIFVLASHRLIAFVINIVDVDSAIARQAYSLFQQCCIMRYIMSTTRKQLFLYSLFGITNGKVMTCTLGLGFSLLVLGSVSKNFVDISKTSVGSVRRVF